MIGLLKKNIKRYLNKDFISDLAMYAYPFGLKQKGSSFLRNFGDKNPDKKFYVIWRDYYGSGFFSNYTFVVCHLLVAKRKGYIPVIDFKNFKTLYNENESIDHTENSWNYYFESLNEYELEEVYQSKNVFFCDGTYPEGFSYNLTEISGANKIVKRIKINNTVKNRLAAGLKIDHSFLGIHFRGREQNLASFHAFGPTYSQIVRTTGILLKKYNLKKIFIVTEDPKAIRTLERKFPNAVFYSNSYRAKNGNAYKDMTVRKHHRYLLGLEILSDAILLSKCSGIIFSDSNVSEYTRTLNDNEYQFQCEIKNGINTGHPIYSKFKYNIIKRLPKSLGGLLNEIIIKEKI